MSLPRTPMTYAMLAIFVVMVAIASQWPEEARFMPYVIGIPAIALCLLQLLLDMRQARRAPKQERTIAEEMRAAEERVSRMTGRQMRFDVAHDANLPTEDIATTNTARSRELATWLAFTALLAGIVLFGFAIVAPLFVFSFLRLIAGLGWRRAAIYAILAGVFIHAVFEIGLQSELHRGLLTEYFVSRIIGF